jgi:hypothetical protein
MDVSAPKIPKVHDEPLFESMRRVATLRLFPPLSDEQVLKHVETYATRGVARSYRKFSALVFLLIASIAVGPWATSLQGRNMTLATAALLAPLPVAALIWRGNRAGMIISVAAMLYGFIGRLIQVAAEVLGGKPVEAKEVILSLGIYGFFLHVFAAALQIEFARRRARPPVTPAPPQ